jgi:hypothetical protein
MRPSTQYLVDGIDRLGKSTLIKNLQDELGYHLVVHYDKPKRLKVYEHFGSEALFTYQYEAYKTMFNMINCGLPVIFDRAHLGEMVYAPMYRGYDGDYVLDIEKEVNTRGTRLVLLTTSDFSFLKDDGLSFDFSKKEAEQALFIQAFHKSSIADKLIVDVSNGKGSYKTPDQILAEVLRK